MRLRTFTATDMPSAMKMVREALGDDAIILATESLKGKKGISVTAASDEREEWQAPAQTAKLPDVSVRAQPPAAEQLHADIEAILRFHNIPDFFIQKIMARASGKDISSMSALHHISANRDEKPLLKLALEKLMAQQFQFAPLSFEDKPLRLMLVGPPGIGKTLTIAKIAALLATHQHEYAVFTTDNRRAGGIEQLQAFTDILETPLHVAQNPTDLKKQLKELPPGNRHVIIDTAGCNPYNNDELQELKSLSLQKDIEPVMVLPAGGDSLETVDIVETFAILPIKRLLVTRADTTRRFGGIIAAAAAHKLAFSNISNSASIINSLAPVNGGILAQMLLRYQLQQPK